jgi:signal transduction histidine kinase/PAS domain-containing protein/ABC-type amino acid transport substrate-binding protein
MVTILFTIHYSLFTPLSAKADNAPDSIISFSTERPLVYEDAWDLWPYSFLNENGEPVGYNIDLLKLICKRLDIPYVIKLKPTSEALEDLKEGHSDLMMGMDAKFHDDFALYGKSVLNLFTHSVVHQKGSQPKVRTIGDLSKYRVIVHEGSFSHHLMKDNGWGSNAEGYEDMKDAILKANSDPECEIVWNTMSLKWLIQKYQATNLQLTPIDIPHGEYKFMSNNSHLLQQLDSVYKLLYSEEQLQPIQNKWFYPERTETGIPSWIWKLAVALAVLAVVSLLYYLFYRIQEKRVSKDLQKKNARLSLVLNTSNVRFWTYDIPTKTFTWMDKEGKAERNYSILEFSQRYRREDFERLTEAINQLVRQEKESVTLEMSAKDKGEGGEDREFTIALSVLRRQKSGRPSVIIGTRSDITEERQMQQKAEDAMLRYQAIFNSAMIDMVYYDENGILTDMNQKAGAAFEGGKDAIIAKKITIADVLGEGDVDLQKLEPIHLTQIFKSPDDERALNKHLRRGLLYYELQLMPIYDQNHRLLCIYGTGRNVTEVANSYNRKQENLRQLTKANEEVTSYIQNINYVLKVGGIRMVNYSANTHTLTIYNEIGHEQYSLTQTRALALVSDKHKHMAQRILNSMDNHAISPINTTIETTLRVKEGYPLCLQIHFVPLVDDSGKVANYFGMCRDVSEMKHTENELAKESAKAQEVETVKNAFLRNMSYEIRTPLNTVVGFAELFQMEHSSDDEVVFVEQIKENSRNLLKLINNILFLSRLDAQMIEIKTEFTDFAQLFDVDCSTSWENLRQDGVEYIIENPYKQLVVDIDAQNLGIVIDQIVTNACQHTTQGFVRTRIDYIGDRLIIAVDDTGEGIEEKFLPTLFERFATGANTGSGLGLSICYELMQQMGGSINIKSTHGKGTTVWVTLPCKTSEIVRK